MSDQHVEVAIASAEMLLEVPEKLQDTELTTQIVDVLAKLTQKEFYDEAVLRFQHAQALDCLAKLRMAIRSIKGTSPRP